MAIISRAAPMVRLSPGQWDVLVISTAVKLLLFPAYRSTDFEVHRNWLAITHHLPQKQWYFDTTSQWTLDYPPFFAYFSYVLSLPAAYLLPLFLPNNVIEPILSLSDVPVETGWTVGYMRGTVMVTELVLLAGLMKLTSSNLARSTLSTTMALSIFLHPGFLFLDSVHFQYNGFLFGLMIWSLWGASEALNTLDAEGSAFFAALLNFKHIYIYLAPAWFVYLFRGYVLPPNAKPNPVALGKIGATVLAVFAISVAPFLYYGVDQGKQLLARLFPFTRGLMHAYWAPNVWALVALLDRVLLKASNVVPVIRKIGISSSGVASASRGLVGDTYFAILPDIKPIHCFTLTAAAQLICLLELMRRPTYVTFLRSIAHCGFASFMFGWHVHEKAVMLVLVPLSFVATLDDHHYRTWKIATAAGTFSLFPLLFTAGETPFKLIYTLVWSVLSVPAYRPLAIPASRVAFSDTIDRLERIYLLGFLPLQAFVSLSGSILPAVKDEKWDFVPLMLTSVYCAVGLVWSWARLGWASWKVPSKGR